MVKGLFTGAGSWIRGRLGPRVVRRNPSLPGLMETGLVLVLAVLFVAPLVMDDQAHRALNAAARTLNVTGNAFIGLDLTLPRAGIYSLVRDLRQDLELHDHSRVVSSRTINLMQYLTRGSLETVGDLVDAFGVPLTSRQAEALDLCRSLDDLKPGERLVVQPDPWQYGIASWYGPGFHGRMAASGEIYNMYDMTAAHRTLPLQTLVRVVHQRTGESVVVRINDRGPYVAGRTLDLSWRAKEQLGMAGLGAIYVEVLDSDADRVVCP